VHLVPGCPAHVLLPLLVLFYDMFEQINNQSINQSTAALKVISTATALRYVGLHVDSYHPLSLATRSCGGANKPSHMKNQSNRNSSTRLVETDQGDSGQREAEFFLGASSSRC